MDYKNTMRKNLISNLGALFVIVVLLMNVITAFGITKSNSDNFPLMILPGESGSAWIEFQNTQGNEDVVASVKVVEGREIVSNIEDLESSDFTIESGEVGRRVNLEIDIPENAEIGTKYNIVLSVLLQKSESGILTFNSEIVQNIPVSAGEPLREVANVPIIRGGNETENPSSRGYGKAIIFLVAIAIILIVVRVMIVIGRKRE